MLPLSRAANSLFAVESNQWRIKNSVLMQKNEQERIMQIFDHIFKM